MEFKEFKNWPKHTYKIENGMVIGAIGEAFTHKAKEDSEFKDWAEYWTQDGAATRNHLLDRDQVQELCEVLNWWAPRFENWARREGAEAEKRGEVLMFAPPFPWLMARDAAIYLEAGDSVSHFTDQWHRAGK